MLPHALRTDFSRLNLVFRRCLRGEVEGLKVLFMLVLYQMAEWRPRRKSKISFGRRALGIQLHRVYWGLRASAMRRSTTIRSYGKKQEPVNYVSSFLLIRGGFEMAQYTMKMESTWQLFSSPAFTLSPLSALLLSWCSLLFLYSFF